MNNLNDVAAGFLTRRDGPCLSLVGEGAGDALIVEEVKYTCFSISQRKRRRGKGA